MAGSKLRVAQWGTGDVGRRAMRGVLRHPRLQLVGALVYDEGKIGKDAGEVCGEPPAGVLCTVDRNEILGLKPDCVIYTPRATGPAASRAGLSVAEVLDDVVPLLEGGANIVTTVTDFHAGGHPRLGAGLDRLKAACERGGSSIFATGSDPGFALEQLPFTFLALQREIRSISILEYGDMSRRPSPHMLFEQVGFGKPMSSFIPEARSEHLIDGYGQPLAALARAAGFEVDEIVARGEAAAAKNDTELLAGRIEAGTIGAQRYFMSVISGGKQVVKLEQYMYVTAAVEPDWGIGKSGWRVIVDGDAPFDVRAEFPVPTEQIGQYVPAYNANLAVNSIPYVCAAAPGFVTSEQMPPIVPAGPIADR